MRVLRLLAYAVVPLVALILLALAGVGAVVVWVMGRELIGA